MVDREKAGAEMQREKRRALGFTSWSEAAVITRDQMSRQRALARGESNEARGISPILQKKKRMRSKLLSLPRNFAVF